MSILFSKLKRKGPHFLVEGFHKNFSDYQSKGNLLLYNFKFRQTFNSCLSYFRFWIVFS